MTLKVFGQVVSLDVVSLFTKVPIVGLLELLTHHFEGDILVLFKHINMHIFLL